MMESPAKVALNLFLNRSQEYACMQEYAMGATVRTGAGVGDEVEVAASSSAGELTPCHLAENPLFEL
jgi:hypothetical protein